MFMQALILSKMPVFRLKTSLTQLDMAKTVFLKAIFN